MFQHESSSNLFYKLLYAFNPPRVHASCLFLQWKPLQKAPPMATLSFMHPASIPCPFAAEGLQPPRRQLLLPLGKQKAKAGKQIKKRRKKKSLCTHDMPSSKLEKAGMGSKEAIPCSLVWAMKGVSCFPGTPSQEQRSGSAEGLLQSPAQRPSSWAKRLLSLQILLLLLV